VDGIPLALELAAARLGVLAPEQIARRLDDQFRLLAVGSRTAVPRHQTLRAALDWSYDLLSPEEQALLRRLSVFSGNFSLEAAEAVCGHGDRDLSSGRDDPHPSPLPEGEGADRLSLWERPARRPGEGRTSSSPSTQYPGPSTPLDVLDLLGALVEKSLVQIDHSRQTVRYRLLEPMRQYAGNRLAEAVEEAATRDRHRDWCIVLAEAADRELRGPAQALWFERLEAENENLWTALAWSVENDPRSGLRLAAALWWFWFVRVYQVEGGRWLEQLVARVPASTGEGKSSDLALAANAHTGAAWLASGRVDRVQLIEHATQGLRLARVRGEPAVLGRALWIASRVDYVSGIGYRQRGQELLAEVLALARARGLAWDTALALLGLADVEREEGDPKEAQSLYEQSLILFRQCGDSWGIGRVLGSLGSLLLRLGEFGRARTSLDEARVIAQQTGSKFDREQAAFHLGLLARETGDHRRALQLVEESVHFARYRGPNGAIYKTAILGDLARAAGDLERARSLLTESLNLLRDPQHPWSRDWCLRYLGLLAVAQGHHRRGVRLIAAAAKAEPDQRTLYRFEVVDLEASLSAARRALGDDAFATAWTEGEAMASEDVLAHALEEDGP
jgi:tetratricopeptide (TPR) repeat protein